MQQSYVQVVKKVGPSVVEVRDSKGLGSGVVFDQQGDVLTNYHVVAGAGNFEVLTGQGKVYPAQLRGAFATDDLALLQVSVSDLHPATFANSSKLAAGDIVLAIGSPLGLASSVTQGIVSATGRTVYDPTGTAIPDAIQTSAAINPGNSGGALVGLNGQVVGIPTLAASDPQLGGSAPGIGFAIPSNTAKDIADQIIKYGKVVHSHRAYLGVEAGNTTAGGVVVVAVQSNGPADQAGIQPGDLIVAVNGTTTRTTAVLDVVLADLQPNQKVSVSIVRGGRRMKVAVTLGQFPAGSS